MYEIINNYDLFIFDLDDTLIKSEKYHYNSWLSVLKEEIGENFYIDFNTFVSKFHSNEKDSIKNYLIEELKIENYEDLIKNKNKFYLELVKKEKKNLQLIPGASKFLENIINNKKKFVIVSNSFKGNVDFFSEMFPILNNSSKNYYREMLKNKKPHPECYIKVCEDFPNMRMVGFEDSITGVHAMNQVECIDTIFINDSNYFYYDYILKNYKLKSVISNYLN
jgi:HAD superfamily hydrolase (TIGR01509 family)